MKNFQKHVLAIVFLLSAGAAQGAVCPSLLLNASYQSPRKAEVSDAYREVLADIEAGYSHFDGRSKWASHPRRFPHLERLVENLVSLTPEQRNHVADLVQKWPPRDSRVREIFNLALYDETAWLRLCDRMFSRPFADDRAANSYLIFYRNMPDSLRAKLIEKLSDSYGKTSTSLLAKRNFTIVPPGPVRASPKRAADIMLQHLLKVDELIGNAVASGSSPLEAYDRYFSAVRDIVSKDVARGVYRAEDVLSVAKSVQRTLIAKSDALGVHDPVVRIAGSFPNGRASFNSDVDTQVSDPRLKSLMDDFTGAVNIQPSFPFVKTSLHFEAMHDGTTMAFAAQVNPVVLRVTKTEIAMEVYPPLYPLDHDNKMLPYNYPAPKVYTIEGSRTEIGAFEVLRSEREQQKELVTKLSSYNQSAWDEYFDTISKHAQDNDGIYNALVPLFEKMPDELGRHLLKRAGEVYGNLKRAKWTITLFPPGRKFLTIGPKRSVDLLISSILKPKQRIAADVARGVSPIEAYSRFLSLTKNEVLSGVPNGGYDAHDVIAASRKIQAVLKEKAKALNIDNPELIIAGSFPSGRANLATSDIDAMVNDARLARFFPEMNEHVNQALRSKHPEVKLEVHPMLSTTTMVNAAIVAPLIIEITPKSIRLLVYDRFRPLPGDDWFLPENYSKPDAYELFTDRSGSD